ncbi:MAG: hypothetical protein ACE5Z5_12550 [Candidatus Bathyarchaeia archaeon]
MKIEMDVTFSKMVKPLTIVLDGEQTEVISAAREILYHLDSLLRELKDIGDVYLGDEE